MGSATEACSSAKENMFVFGLIFSQGSLKAGSSVMPIFASSFVQSTWDADQAIGIS